MQQSEFVLQTPEAGEQPQVWLYELQVPEMQSSLTLHASASGSFPHWLNELHQPEQHEYDRLFGGLQSVAFGAHWQILPTGSQ